MLGEVVLYRLSAFDAAQINGRPFASPPDRSLVQEGQVLPAVVTAEWDVTVNLQVLLDGEGSYWATARTNGSHPGQWKVRAVTKIVPPAQPELTAID